MPGVSFEPQTRPELASLIRLYRALGEEDDTAPLHFAQKSDFKKALSERVIETVRPIRHRMAQLDDAEVERVLQQGARQAREIAVPMLEKARRACRLV